MADRELAVDRIATQAGFVTRDSLRRHPHEAIRSRRRHIGVRSMRLETTRRRGRLVARFAAVA
ncbi:hypothetical protein ACN6K9_001501 [Streptomyces sp. SAS_267]|uniref:hypothetical protein n=1 Tax=Streptomyces sp. SAS_267 TaxID=3412750 RepID=UPI00403CA689